MVGLVFGVFFLLIIIGVPIAVAVIVPSLLVSIMDPTFAANAVYVFRNMITGINTYTLIAVPLFMLSSELMARGGMSDRLFDFFAYFFGHTPAGFPVAVVITCLFYGAICGSAPATVAAIGGMCIPLLVHLGYDKKFVVSMIAVAGGLGVIIPPSLPFITYGMATGVSVGDLFMAGFIPGIVIGLCLIVYVIIYCKKHDMSGLKIAEYSKNIRDRGLWDITKRGIFALLAPIVILGGIYTGIVSPTEAACIAVVYSLLVSVFVFHSLNLRELVNCFVATGKMATPVLLIFSVCTVFGRILALLNVPQTVADAVTSSVSSKFVVLVVINLFLLVVGMLMENGPAILILAPILLQVLKPYDVDPLHFGIVMVTNLAIGYVTPPIGTNLFVANSLTDIPIMVIAKHAVPFIIMFLVALVLITAFPEISTFLPMLLK